MTEKEVNSAMLMSLRFEEHETTHIIRLMAWLFSMLKPEERLLGSIDVLEKGFGFIKLWKSYSYDDNNLQDLQVSCSQDTHNN